MEDKPVFKFKKINAKLVGGINVLGPNTYDYLEAKGFASEVTFMHIKKMWTLVETEDVLDQNMNVTSPGIKRKPEFHIIRGFIKDGKLVAEKTHVIKSDSVMGIEEKYSGFLRECLSQGWKIDNDMYDYFGKTNISPTYHMAANHPQFGSGGFGGDMKIHVPPQAQTQTQTIGQQLDVEPTPKSNTNVFQRILKTIKIK